MGDCDGDEVGVWLVGASVIVIGSFEGCDDGTEEGCAEGIIDNEGWSDDCDKGAAVIVGSSDG